MNSGETYIDYRYYAISNTQEPRNYVKTPNYSQKFRIIGVVDGKVKVVYPSLNNNFYAIEWDSGNSNNWSSSSLKTYLNTTWYSPWQNELKELMQSSTWYTTKMNEADITSDEAYKYEHAGGYGASVSTWNGIVGTISPSDYGYAIDPSNSNRTTSQKLWNYGYYYPVYNWLAPDNYERWLITGTAGYTNNTWYTRGPNLGLETNDYTVTTKKIPVPTFYLYDDVIVTSGDGSKNNQYVLER